jgi:hypothetical protein
MKIYLAGEFGGNRERADFNKSMFKPTLFILL